MLAQPDSRHIGRLLCSIESLGGTRQGVAHHLFTNGVAGHELLVTGPVRRGHLRTLIQSRVICYH